MGRQKSYDYIVIGSGAAGRAAALNFVAEKKSVAIIEAQKWGGASINTRDLLYETALKFSHLYYSARQGLQMGISSGNLRYNYPTALNYRNRIIKKASTAVKKQLTETGIDCINGFANFINKKEIVVNGEHLSGKNYIVATGRKFTYPQISGLETISCYNSDNAFAMKRPPKRLTIVGGGWSGCMIAQYYAELGSQVTLFDKNATLLSREDVSVCSEATQWLNQELKVQIITNANVMAIENNKAKNTQKIFWQNNNSTKSYESDVIVLATGYTPFTDLGLENANVKYTRNGIKTNKNNRTNNKRIFAVGSVMA